MQIEQINEQDFMTDLRERNVEQFLQYTQQFEKQIAPVLRANGYKRINQSERTVTFIFGEVTFTRSRWYKNGNCYIPLDEKLGLRKNCRFSRELLYQLTHLASYMSYRQVAEVIELVYGLYLTKDTVLTALKTAGKLLDEKEDYRFYQEENQDKKPSPPILYIEGDGVMVKSSEEESTRKNIDLSHFLVHEGSQKIGKNRYGLKTKKAFISTSNLKAREAVIDYLHNTYEMSSHTILVTNSDGGKGYTPYIFKEIAKALKLKCHEHFWDGYHVNSLIKEKLSSFPEELKEGVFKAIYTQDKSHLKTMLDTAESLIEAEEQLADFQKFSRNLWQNFSYTYPAALRGLPTGGIGVMESQHRKITYRMKRRGMYWSIEGANRMSRIILLRHEGNLRDLFFGDWTKDYLQYSQQGLSAAEVKAKMPRGVNHGLFKQYQPDIKTGRKHYIKRKIRPQK